MTEDQIKEALSKEFLRMLAYGHGYKVIEPGPDHGVDMIVYPVTRRIEPSGRTRFLDSPYKLDFQLKATTATGVLEANEHIKFDLEVKNYNDLIQRRNEPLPLHLVLVVLNSAPPPACLTLDREKLSLIGSAYWYLPEEGAEESENQQQIRISIPKTNQLTLGFVRDRFEEFGIDI